MSSAPTTPVKAARQVIVPEPPSGTPKKKRDAAKRWRDKGLGRTEPPTFRPNY
ncbi:hypothetical protein LTS15_004936 [Exophiala xenobiotica]|nr:hypothetical protein LTS15_004936 [Exophiala xenobiotica]